MSVGDPGNESYQHVPDFPASRINLDKSLGGYTKSNQYDPSVPATQHHQDMWDGNFSMDLSQGKFTLFLQSPRHFWMQYNGPFEASHSSASFTVNERVGTLAESTTDAGRPLSPVTIVIPEPSADKLLVSRRLGLTSVTAGNREGALSIRGWSSLRIEAPMNARSSLSWESSASIRS